MYNKSHESIHIIPFINLRTHYLKEGITLNDLLTGLSLNLWSSLSLGGGFYVEAIVLIALAVVVFFIFKQISAKQERKAKELEQRILAETRRQLENIDEQK